MSGHNKWSSIKHKKAAADAKRGKSFSRISKELTLAAKAGGGDAELNARLRSAVSAARAASMPMDNIDRAIKKGTGELGGGTLEVLNYEGYAPGGVAVMVTVMTDNRNRTASSIRACFARHNSNLAASGAVSWQFHRKSRFMVEGDDANEEKLLEVLLEAGADVQDVTVADATAEIVAAPDAFADVIAALEKAGITIKESGLTMVPENTVELKEAGIARQVLRLIEALEEDEEVQEVFSNFDLADDLMKTLANE